MKYYVGIDIGTSSAKLLLINQLGEVLKDYSSDYSVIEKNPGWKEIDPNIWMQAVDDCMKEILKEINPQDVEAIGVTGQMHTVAFIDSEGNSIRPALMWNDTRTKEMVPKIKEQIRKIPEVSYISNIISTGSPAMNLLWLKQNEPQNFTKIHKFLIGPDYIVHCLTGKYQTDYCEASTSSLCDLNTGEWSVQLRELFQIPQHIYPEIKGSGEVAGKVTKFYQEKYGFRKDVQVLVGTGDNPAAAISTGCFAKKYPVLSFGTSGVLMFPKDRLEFDVKGKNILFSIDGKEKVVLVQGSIQSCGSTFSWWMDKILNTHNYNEETQLENMEHLGENELIFYPHLIGDKTVYADPNIRGCFIGLGTSISRKDMTIAVMEGICFAVKQLIEVMKIPKERIEGLRVTGGGSKNEIWMQVLADVLETTVVQLESTSGAGYGIALLAATKGTQNIPMEKIIETAVNIKKSFSPREYNSKLYKKKYEKYLRIYKALKSIE